MFKRSNKERKASAKSLSTNFKLGVQPLEERRLMAADIDLFSSGLMDVDGTNGRDIIEIKDYGTNQIQVAVMNQYRVVHRGSDNVPKIQVFNKSDVDTIRVDAFGGNDTVRNYTNVETDINGGSGNDSLYGGSGYDNIDGGAGDDYIHGGSGDDYLYGGLNKDTIYGSYGNDDLVGSSGDDYMNGGSGHDWLHGGSGNDRMYGGSGNDDLEGSSGNDYMYGGSGNDTLYGDSGNDRLYGESGNDGLFGGSGFEWLHAGSGRDRIIFDAASPDAITGVSSDDAIVTFQPTARQDVRFQGQAPTDATYGPGSWTDSEIEKVDAVLAELHDATNSTTLLKTADKSNLQFFRAGSWEGADDGSNTGQNILGWNGGSGRVTIADRGIDGSSSISLRQTVIHEIGHNWDDPEENSTVDDFRALSGWTNSATALVPITNPRLGSRPVGFILVANDTGRDANDNWWYTSGKTNFAREYGRTNPWEDFATSFAAYFLQDDFVGSAVAGTTLVGADATPSKMNYMESFIGGLA